MEDEAKKLGGTKYATVFNKKVLGIDCDIDVVVDIVTLDCVATIAMKRMFSSQPAFVISLDNLRLLEENLKSVVKSAVLLESLIPSAADHQLNIGSGGASAIVVRPPGKPARYTLSIGMFHREGALSDLQLKDIGDSIVEIEALVAATIEKVRSNQSRV